MDEIFHHDKFKADYFYIDDVCKNPSALSLPPIVDYDIVILIQLISLEIIKKIKCNNIIFIPMYDFSVSWDAIKWLDCIDLKILCPTKKMHSELCEFGLNSFYIKYYPEPYDFIPGNLKNVFLWQRVNDININLILKLLQQHAIEKIHLHRALDPHNNFVEPSKAEIAKYNITFSDWFQNQNQYIDCIRNAGIYIAPRLREGGAAAFIDGMKMGKIVVAHNDGAMNEYIEHGVNGILFDVNNAQIINFDEYDIPAMQKNAFQSVIDGRKKWLESIENILSFIDSNHVASFSPKNIIKIRDSARDFQIEEVKQFNQLITMYKTAAEERFTLIKKLFRIIRKHLFKKG
ncbi:MAG TPA: glycosyltransferase [Coxiellaceae bacterium]|nr:glycosyltransferase [Coxiellaceae bacterium]